MSKIAGLPSQLRVLARPLDVEIAGHLISKEVMNELVLALTTTDFATTLALKRTGMSRAQYVQLMEAVLKCRAEQMEIKLWGCSIFKQDCAHLLDLLLEDSPEDGVDGPVDIFKMCTASGALHGQRTEHSHAGLMPSHSASNFDSDSGSDILIFATPKNKKSL